MTNDTTVVAITTEEWGAVDAIARLAWDLAGASCPEEGEPYAGMDPREAADAIERDIRARVIALIGATR